MTCPNCRGDSRADGNFCHLCGVMLRPYCIVCRLELPDDSHFCFKCGSNLSGSVRVSSTAVKPRPSAPLTAPTVPVVTPPPPVASGDRRFVAVLFADLSGFTAMSEKMDAEKVTDIVNQCFQRLGKIVFDLGGHIDKYMGDCIMALFGAPVSHENDPELAVDCALQMMIALEKFNQESGNTLGLSIGINAGMVVAGGVGSEGKVDYTVMGDTVNTAQRLQSAAKRGEIFVSRSVKRSCEKIFEFDALPPLKVKGKEEPLEAFSVRPKAKPGEVSDKVREFHEPALIGRDLEVGIIKKLLGDVGHKRGQILLLSGEPGIGKSRLRSEMRKMALDHDYQWFEAKCTTLTRETPYFLFTSLVRSVLGIDNKAEHSLQHEQLKSLERFGLDKIAQTLIRELIHLPLPEDAELRIESSQKKNLLNQAIKNLIVATTRIKPSVVYLEDLQWIDILSRDVLALILDSVPKLPLMISGGLRPDFVHDWTQKKNCTQLSLAPLTTEQCLELVQKMLSQEHLPKELINLIETKCDGNPLYAEEIVKNLQDLKVLVHENGVWSMTPNFKIDQIPTTLQGLIASRIDLLSEAEKIVLQYASVIGRRFSLRLLTQLVPRPQELGEVLEQLRLRELIFEAASSDGDGLFTFNHALMQDVAYQSILLKNRRVFHGRVGELIEATHRGDAGAPSFEDFEALSYHFLEAESFEKAVEYLYKSGKVLYSSYDNAGAVKAFDRAVEIYAKCNPEILSIRIEDIYSELAMVLGFVGGFERSEKIQFKIIEIVEKSGDLARLSRCHRYLGQLYQKMGHFDRALEANKKALKAGMEAGDFEAQVRAWKGLANIYRDLADLPQAMSILEEGLVGARALGHEVLIAEYHNDMAITQLDQNRLDEAAKNLEEAIAVATKNKELKSLLATSTNNLGLIHHIKGEFDLARPKFAQAAAVAVEIGDLKNIVIAKNNLAEALIELGGLEEARAELETTLQVCQTSGNQFGRVSALILKAWIETHIGNVQEAEESLSTLIEEAVQRKYWGLYTDAHCFLARSQAKRGDCKLADLTICRAKEKMSQLGNHQAVARCEDERKKIMQQLCNVTGLNSGV